MQLYFDADKLSDGNFFNLTGKIETEEGHSYELEDWLGRGGNAAVFRCQHRTSGDRYAIKFLMNLHARNFRRFSREIELLQSITTSHTTKYHGAGRVEVKHSKSNANSLLPFVVMELAECNLQDVMRTKTTPISYEQYAGQFRGLAKALAVLHNHAVHRDIKPENILVAEGRWLLSDYGLCTFVNRNEDDLTREEENIGPKFWLSPEAHNRRLGWKHPISAASDVFQLAAVFWYVATGRHPSGILTKSDWIGPEKLFEVLQKSLFHDSTKRPQNGDEFHSILSNALIQ